MAATLDDPIIVVSRFPPLKGISRQPETLRACLQRRRSARDGFANSPVAFATLTRFFGDAYGSQRRLPDAARTSSAPHCTVRGRSLSGRDLPRGLPY